MKKRPPAPARKKKASKTPAKIAGSWISNQEMAHLRDSLRDAQETLEAIRNGEVDAVVVNGQHGSQVYSLAGAEQPYRVYVEQMQEGAVTVSSDGIILFCNQRFADMVGEPLERVISSPLTARISVAAWNQIAAVLGDATQAVKHEDILQSSRGSDIAVSFTASRLPLDDQSVICLVVADLTVLREQESLRLAKEVADKANRAKDMFLAALSHELRTPLTPALMAVADMESDTQLPEEFRDTAGLIRRCIELETRLIDDLLDITRIAHGKLDLKSQPVDLHAALRGALEICRHDILSKQLRVAAHLEAARHNTQGDVVRIQQAFWNVIRNAVKFTPNGGSIVIRSGNDGQQGLWLEVSDSGVGFAADAASRLFTAFQQEDDSVARHFGGLGLGLTITRSVLDAHGGSISGSSQGRDKGATFIIRLPLSDSVQTGRELTPGSPLSPAVAKSAGLRLLLVEDHEETSLTMQRLLKRLGHEVIATNSAHAALERAAANSFDLVISDLGLPDMSGTEMMQQMRDRHGLKGIAVSGFGTEEDIAESHASGFVHHLTKPISMERLNAMLSDLG